MPREAVGRCAVPVRGSIERYRCHTGHAFSEQALAAEGASRYRDSAKQIEQMMQKTRELAQDPALNPARAVGSA